MNWGGLFARAGLFVERRVGEVHVLLVHAFLGQGNSFAEALKMDDFAFPQEADDIVHIRVVGETENVIVGEAGLLLWCDLVRTTYSAFSGIETICNAVDLVLQAFQGFLKALPIHGAVAGGQLGQKEHLVEGAVNLLQALLYTLGLGGIPVLLHLIKFAG